MKNKIISYINDNKQWLIGRIIDIVSVNTINSPPYGNENNGQDIIEKIFKNMGLKIDRFSPDDVSNFKDSKVYLKGRDYTNRDNLVGFVGKGEKKTLIFNGHIDTVPSHDFKWTKTQPFEPKLIDGKIYGLGACDMKGGLIASIFALKTITDLDIPIKGKVIIESVVDEEFGGANGSLACVKKGYIGDFAIIAEPTVMKICVSNVCSRAMEIKITGDKGLMYIGEGTEGANPLLLAARLISALKDYESYLNSLKCKYEIYKNIDKPMKFLFSDIKAGEIGPDKIITTPEECLIRIYTMNYPDINKDKFTDMMLSFLKKYPDIYKYIEDKSIVFSKNHRFIEGGDLDLTLDSNKEFVNNIIKNGKKLTNRKLGKSAFLGGTDFFAFSNYGNTPVVILGPGGGNCHAPDEYVNLEDLLDLSKIYAGLIYDYCC
ncbi:MAG: ArgE/DapE family deacylase [Actinomycetia bacterium]|nr:ArgE/DapE family deacylase [Actinomycetes bacterium]